MRSYIVFLWNGGAREYLPCHVNLLARAIKRFDTKPHRFICITDETDGFSKDVEIMPLPEKARQLCNLAAPQGNLFPSSYRRMWLLSEEAKTLGDRVMLLDIDCAIVGELESLWDVDSDFVGWQPACDWGRRDRVGGGTWLLKTGRLAWLWDIFIKNPAELIESTRAMGWNGSDQAILSRFLRSKYPVWPDDSGIYATQDGVFEWDLPPKNAKIIHFNGQEKLWHLKKPWIRAYCNYFKDKDAGDATNALH